MLTIYVLIWEEHNVSTILNTCKLACAHTQQKKFPQAKRDSQIIARFLLNGHGDLYFLLYNNSVDTFLLNLKRKTKNFLSEGKQDIGERVHETGTL